MYQSQAGILVEARVRAALRVKDAVFYECVKATADLGGAGIRRACCSEQGSRRKEEGAGKNWYSHFGAPFLVAPAHALSRCVFMRQLLNAA
jgi:hypothetical protein